MSYSVSSRLAAMVAAVLLTCMSTSGHAEGSGAKRGETIALKGTPNGVVACVSCHGTKGEGLSVAGFPRLAGLGNAYLEAQLDAFAAGYRKNSVMQPIAKGLIPAERLAVAGYFSTLPSPLPAIVNDKQDVVPSDKGAWLATRGRWADGVPACVQCHGAGGAGIGDQFPPLAGQSAMYLENQLRGWKTGLRPPGPAALMVVIAGKLTDREISEVAKYYANLTTQDLGKANSSAGGPK